MKYKYRGIIKNRVNGEVRKTRYYSTYEKAHRQAEALGERVYGRNDNWAVDVIAEEVKKKMRVKNNYVFLVKQWFDKVNGNTYHSVEYHDFDTGKTISSGRVYGYGDVYKFTAYEMMVKHGYSTDPSPRDFWKNNSIYYHVVEVSRKRDLV